MRNQTIVGIVALIIGVMLLAADRLFVAAATANYSQSVTVLTTVSILFFLVGGVLLFRLTRSKK